MVTHVDDQGIAVAAAAARTADVPADTDNTVKGAPKSSPSIVANANVPAAVSNEQDEITDEKVCRFLITNLQGGNGYAKTVIVSISCNLSMVSMILPLRCLT